MRKRDDFNHQSSNDELARRLFQRDKRLESSQTEARASATPEPLASRREPNEGPQTWTLGRRPASGVEPVSEPESRALHAALSKGTRANLGREPTLTELVQLIKEVDRARALVASARDAIDGKLSVYLDEGLATFRGSVQRMTLNHDEQGRRTA